jgi:hypothetical protein
MQPTHATSKIYSLHLTEILTKFYDIYMLVMPLSPTMMLDSAGQLRRVW